MHSPNPQSSDLSNMILVIKHLLGCMDSKVANCLKAKLEAEVRNMLKSGTQPHDARKIQEIASEIGLELTL